MAKLDLSQFRVLPHSYGCYACTYYTPVRGDYYKAKIFDMTYIDDYHHRGVDGYPTQAALRRLRERIIATGTHYNSKGEIIDF